MNWSRNIIFSDAPSALHQTNTVFHAAIAASVLNCQILFDACRRENMVGTTAIASTFFYKAQLVIYNKTLYVFYVQK